MNLKPLGDRLIVTAIEEAQAQRPAPPSAPRRRKSAKAEHERLTQATLTRAGNPAAGSTAASPCRASSGMAFCGPPPGGSSAPVLRP